MLKGGLGPVGRSIDLAARAGPEGEKVRTRPDRRDRRDEADLYRLASLVRELRPRSRARLGCAAGDSARTATSANGSQSTLTRSVGSTETRPMSSPATPDADDRRLPTARRARSRRRSSAGRPISRSLQAIVTEGELPDEPADARDLRKALSGGSSRWPTSSWLNCRPCRPSQWTAGGGPKPAAAPRSSSGSCWTPPALARGRLAILEVLLLRRAAGRRQWRRRDRVRRACRRLRRSSVPTASRSSTSSRRPTTTTASATRTTSHPTSSSPATSSPASARSSTTRGASTTGPGAAWTRSQPSSTS